MKPKTYVLTFKGGFLERGFWLYVWEITTSEKRQFYYVGRTGDSSSNNAQSPFNRMGQHLLSNENNNSLRSHLKEESVDPEICEFKLIAYGPIFDEAVTQEEHRERRDNNASLEKELADAMKESGYEVLNTVNCRKELDLNLWTQVRDAFAVNFPKLILPSNGD